MSLFHFFILDFAKYLATSTLEFFKLYVVFKKYVQKLSLFPKLHWHIDLYSAHYLFTHLPSVWNVQMILWADPESR